MRVSKKFPLALSLLLFSANSFGYAFTHPLSFTNAVTGKKVAIAKEHLIIRTPYGDMIFALFPELAPKTVKQMIRLAHAGLYDTGRFFRVEPGYLIQVANAQDRLSPATPAQLSIIQRLPAELNTFPHERGVLSMARAENDLNSAETSFAIMLGHAPVLDQKYTVFGAMEMGWTALAQLEHAVKNDGRPLMRLTIDKIEALDEASLARASFRDAVPMPLPDDVPNLKKFSVIFYPMVLVAILSILICWSSTRGSPRTVSALALMILATAAFVVFSIVLPHQSAFSAYAIFLFLAFFGLYRVLSQFES